MNPILTICIATYNRANFIGETLDSIIPQLTDGVELIVVDGASTDSTEQVMTNYLSQCRSIRYVKLSAKGGIDYDYNQAVENATGEYCWLFTDDDIMKKGAVQKVLSHIKQGYDLVIVNGEVVSSDLSKLIIKKRLNFTENKIYRPNDFEKFFIDNARYMSYIGCIVIKKGIWIEREKEKYYGLEFIHMGVIFQEKFRSNIMVISKPQISLRLGNAQWSHRALKIWLFQWPKLLWMFSSLSDKTISKISLKEPWINLTKLSSLRAEGNFGIEEYREFIEPKITTQYKKFAIRVVTLLPINILNFLAIMYCHFKGPQANLTLYNLKNSKYYYVNFLKKSIHFK